MCILIKCFSKNAIYRAYEFFGLALIEFSQQRAH